jgi:Tfp pilus assembly PilM family ATPase
MSRLLAVEWDMRELRVAAAQVAGKKVVVEQAFAIPLDEETSQTPDAVAEQLVAACGERGIGRCAVLMGVPRAKAELRVLEVPNAPDDELPEMVRFQAVRQFSTLGEDWPLDFVPLGSGDPNQTRVLAATISPQLAEDLLGVCSAIGSSENKLVLRPCASASLYGRRVADHQCRLLVELFAGEADLNVVVDGQVVFLRSVRMAPANRAKSLVGEIRRTLAAAQNQLGDQRIQGVTLVGNDAELQDVRPALEEQLDQAIEVFDPFSLIPSKLDGPPLEHPGRFASLLGMVLDEGDGKRHGIDFLNPRKRSVPPDRRRRYAWVAAAVAALVAVLIGGVWWQIDHYQHQVGELQVQNTNLDEQVKIAQQLKLDVGLIDEFEEANINWLDQIYEFSTKLPDASEAIVDTASFTSLPGGGGQIALDGYVSEPDVINRMESDLRDENRQVTGSGTFFDERQQDLQWSFKERIVVLPKSREETTADE